MNTFLGIICLVWGLTHLGSTLVVGWLASTGKTDVNEFLFLARIAFAAGLFYGALRFLG